MSRWRKTAFSFREIPNRNDPRHIPMGLLEKQASGVAAYTRREKARRNEFTRDMKLGFHSRRRIGFIRGLALCRNIESHGFRCLILFVFDFESKGFKLTFGENQKPKLLTLVYPFDNHNPSVW